MVRRSVAVGAILLIALVAVGGVVAPAAAQQDQSDSTTNSTASTPADYSLEQLRVGGEQPANAPAGVRSGEAYGDWRLKNLPLHPFVLEGSDSPMWSGLNAGQMVRRNYVQLASRQYGFDTKDIVIRIAYWETEERVVEREDGSTTSETIATDVVTHTVEGSVSSGYAEPIRVDLHDHFEERKRVTMCVQEPDQPDCLANPDGQRWTFVHKSSQAAQAVSTTSQGGRLVWAFGFVVLPFAGFTAVTLKAGAEAVKHARGGPNMSLLVWAIGGLISIVVAAVFWRTLSRTLIRLPWLFGVGGGILLGVLAAGWYSNETHLELFLRLRAKDGLDPSAMASSAERQPTRQQRGQNQDPITVDGSTVTDGGVLPLQRQIGAFADRVEAAARPATEAEASSKDWRRVDIQAIPGKIVADVIPMRMVRRDGTLTAIKRGLLKFLARFRGARADLEVEGNPQSAIPVDEGPYEYVWLMDPEAENPLDYKAEGFSLEFPKLMWYDEEDRRHINLRAILGGPLVLGIGALAGYALVESAILGTLISAVGLFGYAVVTPEPGHLRAKLAAAQYGNSLAWLIDHASTLGDIKSWESLFTRYHSDKAEEKAKKRELQDEASASQMDELAQRYLGDDPGGRDE